MARIAKTVATATTKKQDFKSMEKTIKGFVTLENLEIKTNSNGKEYLVIPDFGVTYFRISDIKTGIKYGVVQFPSNQEGNEGALALNRISPSDELAHWMTKFPNQSMKDVAETFGIKIG